MNNELKLVTFNVRGAWRGDGMNSFIHRAGMILCKIDEERPDVICFQEVPEKIAAFFEHHMPDYQIFYHGRCEKRNGEGLATAIRRDTMELLSIDCFWLSPTPNVPGSRFAEQSDCPRVCQAMMLRRRGAADPFWVYNNHLDHISDTARILGIRQVMARVAEDQARFRFPVFIVGDFNAYPDSETVRFCDEYKEFPIIELTRGCGTTFHDFGRRTYESHIDYIYVDRATAELTHTVERWMDEYDGIYLTDHYPVSLTIALND